MSSEDVAREVFRKAHHRDPGATDSTQLRARVRQRVDGRVQPACRSRVPSRQAPALCLHVDTTRTDHHPNNPSHQTPRARDLRERLESAADEGLSQRVEKKVRVRTAIQFVRLVGELTAFLPTAFVAVEREGPDGRFLPAKDPEELTRRLPGIRRMVGSRRTLQD